ncbi:50S ribosomal protein L22 [Candidatus Methanoperedenaceae archaeon GB50]|nr:50S ribosomal protein L22 [Candidatus Methanoperedenaceae archaeon GB50]
MARVKYSVEADPDTTARAMGYELHISPKKSIELCKALRGMKTTTAEAFLEDVINMRRPVPFNKYTAGAGHKPGMGPGRYPVKVAREILRLLASAEENATYKGLDPEEMKIIHMAVKKGRTIRGFMPRAMGRATPKNTETVTIELILGES